MKFKAGTKVRQIMPKPVEGMVTGFALDQQTGEVRAHVAWEGGAGFFSEDQLAEVSEEAAIVAKESAPKKSK